MMQSTVPIPIHSRGDPVPNGENPSRTRAERPRSVAA